MFLGISAGSLEQFLCWILIPDLLVKPRREAFQFVDNLEIVPNSPSQLVCPPESDMLSHSIISISTFYSLV